MSDLYHSEDRVVHGRRVHVEWCYDSNTGAPWKEHDGHGPVRHTNHSHRSRMAGKQPGERPLNSADRNHYQYFYDWQEAMKLAKKDGWGLGLDEYMKLMCELRRVPTKGQVWERAVQRDFDYLARWVNDDWHWCGIVVRDIETGVEHSLWGIEINEAVSDYHNEIISELADDMWEEVCQAILSGVAA